MASMSADARLLGRSVAWADVKGFNYQPSYGTTGYELWRTFDARQIAIELDRAKEHFPNINALRWWLSWDAFKRDADGFAANFEAALTLAAERGLAVMPVLFNRWHSSVNDYGGIYIDHFLPGASWLQHHGPTPAVEPWRPELGEQLFDEYLARIVGGHAGDERIFTWDICNEPFAYELTLDQMPQAVVEAELAWLQRMHETCRRLDPDTPYGVSIHTGHGERGLRMVEPLSDVLLIHPYFDNADGILDTYDRIAAESGKPMITTEICWGSKDDAERVEHIRSNLSHMSARGIGWLAYVLNHSLVVDCHRPEHGPVDDYGWLHFIEADGSLRPGHEVFNEF